MKSFISILLIFLSIASFASNDKFFTAKQMEGFSSITVTAIDTSDKKNINRTKVIAVTLAVTLGIFGVHRLYLGTRPLIPIAYTLTLGGGMAILPIIDIFYIITAKDINQLTNNNYMFMWNKKIAPKPES